MIIEEKVLKQLLENEYRRGFKHGTKVLEKRIISASQKGNPIELSDGTVVFIQSDIEHLHSIFAELENNKD
ncbi:MAG: hypothetical protein IJN54_02065 [Lachnospiraceae bacterium]|nr:hypothetical protein [Lachnospiraceae bacterium]